MAKKTWTLPACSDLPAGLHLSHLELGHANSRVGISQRRLTEGLSDGVDLVEVHNGRLSFSVIPTRGMGIWKAHCDNTLLGWTSPIEGPVHPQHVPIFEPSGLGWLDGFDELLVRCGLQSNGAPAFDESGKLVWPLHGRIANRPARHVEVAHDAETGEFEVTGLVEETRFHFAKLRLRTRLTTRLEQPYVDVHDVIENRGGTATTAQLLYHVNFGSPIVESGAAVLLPVAEVVPRNEHAAGTMKRWREYDAPTVAYTEQVYFCRPLGDAEHNTLALLRNAAGDQGVCLHYRTDQLPCFTLWKNTVAHEDGYVTGLEPATNYPNTKPFEEQHGRVIALGPGEAKSFHLRIEYLGSEDEVAERAETIASLQGSQRAKEHGEPLTDWCE